MIKQLEIFAIITARGGSKGIPKKNIRLLNGKPLIAYTIEAAKQSQYIDRVIVSTDSEEIADAAVIAGAEKLFLRPSQFATDESPSWEAIIHALQWIEHNEKKVYPVFCLLQPTSPFRNSFHINEAIEKFALNERADSLVSVCESIKSPYWTQIVSDDGFLQPLIQTEERFTRRQDTPKTFDLNGALYIAKTDFYKDKKTFLGNRTTFYEMDKISSIDIDTETDFFVAESLYARKQMDE